MPRSPPGAYESYPSLLFANARPEALFRYRSKAIAFSSLENARYATKRHGLYGSMWRFPRVMSFDPRSQIAGQSDVGFAGLNQALAPRRLKWKRRTVERDGRALHSARVGAWRAVGWSRRMFSRSGLAC